MSSATTNTLPKPFNCITRHFLINPMTSNLRYQRTVKNGFECFYTEYLLETKLNRSHVPKARNTPDCSKRNLIKEGDIISANTMCCLVSSRIQILLNTRVQFHFIFIPMLCCIFLVRFLNVLFINGHVFTEIDCHEFLIACLKGLVIVARQVYFYICFDDMIHITKAKHINTFNVL